MMKLKLNQLLKKAGNQMMMNISMNPNFIEHQINTNRTLLADIYAPKRTYISVHDDRIQPSNFSYFTFNNLGTYRFILISLRGDADLYISTRDKYVSYVNYEYSSCTCGIDEILIDPYM